MKAFIFCVLAVLTCFGAAAQDGGDGEKVTIYITARNMTPVDVADSTAIAQIGNVVAYHNGSVITCDSLVRYNDQHIECFGNVIINKDSTYVYGERVDYDGERNIAQVFSPLVKMIDGDAVLYTYNFLFNTLDNVGEYYGGGTMTRGETLLESDRGFYYSDSKDIICVGDVELRDPTYQIISDSLGYNTNSEVATFYSKSYIWNEKGEILSADKGWYYTKEERYRFISNAYVLTEDQEIWADDIDYRAEVEDIIMRRNIQIRDEEQKTIGFGDYGLYFGQSGNAMLTEMPSLINFDEENGDSVYMRADSIFLYVLDSTSVYSSEYIGREKEEETTASDGSLIGEEMLIAPPVSDEAMREAQDELTGEIAAAEGEAIESEGEPGNIPQSMQEGVQGEAAAVDSGAVPVKGESPPIEGEPADTSTEQTIQEGAPLAADADGETVSPEPDPDRPKTKAELKAEKKAEKEREKAERKAAKEAKRKEKDAARNPSPTDGATDETTADTTAEGNPTAIPGEETIGGDGTAAADETATPEGEAGAEGADGESIDPEGESADGTDEETEVTEEEKEEERVVVGYHNVRIFRSDFQAICDSIIGFSVDSTMHMHIKPIMWNEDNQINSDLTVVYTKNEKLHRAVYTGQEANPVMGSRLDGVRFNQVTGREIEAFFEDNEVYRVDAKGSAKTYYYLQDEETLEYQGFLVVECADITFHLENRNVVEIVYRVNPVYSIFPMNKIPESQERVMPNFEWKADLRPTKKDVFDRIERPTQREFYTTLPQPLFPLSDKIHTYRRDLIDGGTWRDRTDDISTNAKNFMRNIESGSIVF